MRTLVAHGYELFKLTREKIPLEKGWRTSTPLTTDEAIRWLAHGNVGVRLRDTDLVIDVDPARFVNGVRSDEAFGLPDGCPEVWTPSGGRHIYMLKPSGKVRHEFTAEYPGLEFKSLGRYVVAPGSELLWGTYRWSPVGGDLPAAMAPDWLLEKLKVHVSTGGSGEWTVEMLVTALGQLDPRDYGSNDRWFPIMCAAHEATGGSEDAREAFLLWSAGDELYAADSEVVRARWGSLRAGKEGNAGAGTLRKILLDEGAEVPVGEVRDFEAVVGSGPVEEKVESLMEKMSRWFKAVDEGGRLRVFARQYDEVLSRYCWVRYTRRDFMEVCLSVRHLPGVEVGINAKGEPKFAEASVAWLDHYKKKVTYSGITFAPEHSGDRTPDGKLNLWQGLAVSPRRGEWGYLRELIYENICRGDSESDTYVMNWLARAVQFPWEPGRVALVVKGIKGAGKGTLGRAFCGLFGQHGMHIASPDLVTGRFNAHLRDCVALFADEAFWAGDKAGESKLKALVTEPALAFEGKGQNAEMGRNCLHVFMASNMDWVVPAGFHHERRFAVVECVEELPSAVYWDRLYGQIKDGGLSAMLYDLLAIDLSGFEVSRVPQTEALANQKVATLRPVEQWLFELLDSGEWELLPRMAETDDTVTVLAIDIQDSLVRFYTRHGRLRGGGENIGMQLGQVFKKMVPGVRLVRVSRPAERSDISARPWAYVLPNLTRARQKFLKVVGRGLSFGEESDKSDKSDSVSY